MSRNAQQPATDASNAPAAAASDSTDAATDTQMATASPAVAIVSLPPVATLLELGAYIADPALHAPIHASGCSICDAYVAHLRAALADPALRAVLATLAAAATASSEATAEVAALRSQLAHERGAREQAESTMKTVLETLGSSTSRRDAGSSRDNDRLRCERDMYREQVEDLQDQIRELEDDNDRLEAECDRLAVEQSRNRRKAAATTPSQSSTAEPQPPVATKTPARAAPAHASTSAAGASAPAVSAQAPRAGASSGSASTPSAGRGGNTSSGRPLKFFDEATDEEHARFVREEWDSPDEEPSSRKRSRGRGKGRAGAPFEGSAARTSGPSRNTGTGTAPPRPTARGNQEWRQVRGHWVPTSASPSAASRWERMSDAEIAAAISGEARWETGDINVAQRELYEAVQGTPIRSRSGLVNRVLAFATEMSDASNHPLLQRRWQPEIRVGENGAANITDVLARDWWHALRAMHQGQGNDHFWGRVESLLTALLARPGRYADRVAALFPAAPAPEQDPENETRLTPEHSFPISSFLEPNDIAEDDVVRWLFEQLRVPRRVATLSLSPYFQRAERLRIARDTWAHVRQDTALPLSAARWMDRQRNHIQRFGSADFVPHAVERISLYAEPGSRAVVWQYPRHPNAPLVLDADFGWLTSEVNNLFQPRYAAAVQVLEADQPPPPYGAPGAPTDPDQPMSDAHGAS
ncbi:hypothetical protein FRC12_001278 [Ceratobasidium sp. 428]|nr:hypothetical protein FRC12_001278 [Ceratobasidium sp. 428]